MSSVCEYTDSYNMILCDGSETTSSYCAYVGPQNANFTLKKNNIWWSSNLKYYVSFIKESDTGANSWTVEIRNASHVKLYEIIPKSNRLTDEQAVDASFIIREDGKIELQASGQISVWIGGDYASYSAPTVASIEKGNLIITQNDVSGFPFNSHTFGDVDPLQLISPPPSTLSSPDWLPAEYWFSDGNFRVIYYKEATTYGQVVPPVDVSSLIQSGLIKNSDIIIISPVTVGLDSSLGAIETLAQDPKYSPIIKSLLYHHYKYRPYPYITKGNETELYDGTSLDDEILDYGAALYKYGYKEIIESWFMYYDPKPIGVKQNQRFNYAMFSDINVVSDTTSAPTIDPNQIKYTADYNLNRSIGIKYRTVSDANRCFALYMINKRCGISNITTTQGTTDIVTALINRNVHLDSDMCRAGMFNTDYSTQAVQLCQGLDVVDDQGNKGINILEDQNKKNSILIQDLIPYCQYMSNKFIDSDIRKCCSDKDGSTGYCQYLNSLFTEDGNCSCFMDTSNLIKLLDPEGKNLYKANGIVPSCYGDCKYPLGYPGNAYKAAITPCTSNICIGETNLGINNSNVNINMNDLFCCNGASDCITKDTQTTATGGGSTGIGPQSGISTPSSWWKWFIVAIVIVAVISTIVYFAVR